MRKQTKLVAVLSAAALLAIGASMTSFAASPRWEEQGGTWVYLDKDGARVTDSWKKSGNQYFYLDENGEMATDKIIEDENDKYYVDANGARVTNQWVSTENEDNWNEVENVWYYFGNTGKAYKGKKTINAKTYIFDEGGYMFSGWKEYEVNSKTETFYLGGENEGWALTDWHKLEPSDTMTSSGDEYDDEEWFNFKSSGIARKAGRAYIKGSYYEFDDNGVMISGWVPPVTTVATSSFYTESGNQPKGWVFAYPQDDKNEEKDQQWYYLDSKGHPFNAGSTATSGAVDGADKVAITAKVIKNKTYLFDGTGAMLTGVYKLSNTSRVGGAAGLLLDGIYYFNKDGDSTKGQMATGKTTVTYDGENYYYNFGKKGIASTDEIVDGYLYKSNGTRVNADEGNMIYPLEAKTTVKKGQAIITLPLGTPVVVSSAGKVKQSGTVTIDGTKYIVKDYVATLQQP